MRFFVDTAQDLHQRTCDQAGKTETHDSKTGGKAAVNSNTSFTFYKKH